MATVTAHALGAGHLTIPERFFVKPADPDAKRTVPSLSFLIQHKDAVSGKVSRIVFDLGMRRDLSLYPPALESHLASRQPISTEPDPVASLAKGGLSVDDIDYVMFSHVHYDHVGMPRDFNNEKTKFIVGNGALDLLNGTTKHDLGKHMVFESDLLPLDRTIELPPPEVSEKPSHNHAQFLWKHLGPFPAAIDFFNDGSVYIVNSPGHLPGHVNLLCRLSPNKFIIMAGDACHDVRLLTGERDIATWTDETSKQCCIHVDIPTAKENLARLRAVTKDGIEVDGETERAPVELVFAHDFAWEEDAVKKGRFWPGKI